MNTTTWNSNSDNWILVEFVTDKLCYVYVQMGDGIRSISKKCEEISDYITRIIVNDEDAIFLEKSNKLFESGEFLGFEKSESFIASILDAST